MIQTVKTDSLVFDWTIAPRKGLDDVWVRRLKSAILSGAELPPIVVCDRSMRIVDGFHRVTANLELKREEMPAELRHYDDDTALFRDAVRLNIAHGQPLTPYELAKCALKLQSLALSTKEIAGDLHVTADKAAKMLRMCVMSTSGEKIPLKRGLEHLTAETERRFTESEVQTIARYSGLMFLRQIEQVLDVLTQRMWPQENERVRLVLRMICEEFLRQEREETEEQAKAS